MAPEHGWEGARQIFGRDIGLAPKQKKKIIYDRYNINATSIYLCANPLTQELVISLISQIHVVRLFCHPCGNEHHMIQSYFLVVLVNGCANTDVCAHILWVSKYAHNPLDNEIGIIANKLVNKLQDAIHEHTLDRLVTAALSSCNIKSIVQLNSHLIIFRLLPSAPTLAVGSREFSIMADKFVNKIQRCN